MAIVIRGGSVLQAGAFVGIDIAAGPAGIAFGAEAGERPGLTIDASGLLVLPGIVDIHGDAFERQIQPRPGVGFPLELALIETDRQLIANGITTACHGITWSWEPGLRGAENARALVAAIEDLRPHLAADTLIHLRHETFNLDWEAEILDWIGNRRIQMIAFNDHMEDIARKRAEKPAKLAATIERSGLDEAAFFALVDRIHARAASVPPSVTRLAEAARKAGVTLLSHDDRDIEDRRWFRARGCAIAEFPKTEATAREAIDHGEATVFGAPNVVRGGSHTGCPAAADMVAKGLCSILASDYFYPALAEAPRILARDGVMSLAAAWALVSENPARALGLADRGVIAPGRRADLVLARIEATHVALVATIAGGRLVHCAEGQRLG